MIYPVLLCYHTLLFQKFYFNNPALSSVLLPSPVDGCMYVWCIMLKTIIYWHMRKALVECIPSHNTTMLHWLQNFVETSLVLWSLILLWLFKVMFTSTMVKQPKQLLAITPVCFIILLLPVPICIVFINIALMLPSVLVLSIVDGGQFQY